jgi:myo-inositol 2-dehydrogenase/D-chiro-inositol 1-dehydrogenase
MNYHSLTARAEVVAASSPDLNEHKWAAENLTGARIYKDYYKMLEKENLDAVVVAGITAVHADHTIAAIKKGLHVMCEKPLSLDIKIVRLSNSPNRDIRAKKTRPNLSLMPITSLYRRILTRKSCAVSLVALMLPIAKPTRE